MDWRAALRSLIEDTEAHVKAMKALQPASGQVKAMPAPAPDEPREKALTTFAFPNTAGDLLENTELVHARSTATEVFDAIADLPPHRETEERIAIAAGRSPDEPVVAIPALPAPQSKPTFLELEREEIARRVAQFKALQERIKREREEYCAATLARAREPRAAD
jgi:hypothetical protein